MNNIQTKWNDPYRQGVYGKDEYTLEHSSAITAQHNENIKFYFIFAGVVMLITTPFFNEFIPFPPVFVIIGLLLFALIGSVVDRQSRVTSLGALVLSLLSFVVFEFMAIVSYPNLSVDDWHVNSWFLINQLLALNFFFAIQGSARYLFIDNINRRNSIHFK